MIDLELIMIIWPFILLVVMAAIYAFLYFKFSTNFKKIKSLFVDVKIEKDKLNSEIINYPSIVYSSGYKEGKSSVVSFGVSKFMRGKVFFIHKNIPSGWSFYSTVIMIPDESINHLNVVITKGDVSGFNLYVRDLRERKCKFFIIKDEMDFGAIPNELIGYKEFIFYCLSISDRVAFDLYRGNFVVLFYGRFFSNILKAEEIKNIFCKLKIPGSHS